MVKRAISKDEAREILIDARANLERRLALSVGVGNYNQGPVDDALNAIDMQLSGSKEQNREIDHGYRIDELVDKNLRHPVRRVLSHVNGVSLFPSPDSLRYSPVALALGLDDVALKWASDFSAINPAIITALSRGIIVHDFAGLSGNGFAELCLNAQDYLAEFHKVAEPLMRQRTALEQKRTEYAIIGAGALGGAALGLGAGYLIDTSHLYNFYTQLLFARFPVAMLESAGVAVKPITSYAKSLIKVKEEEPVVKESTNNTDPFAIWNLSAPGIFSLVSAGGELTSMNKSPVFDGIANVEINNGNNQLGLVGMYKSYVGKYGFGDGTKRFFRDPFVLANLVVTGSYMASAVLARSSGLKIDTGVKSGGEAGVISADTTIVTALAMTAIYTHYLLNHHRMLHSGIREKLYDKVAAMRHV